MNGTDFNTAFDIFITELKKLDPPVYRDVLVVRDMFGRVRLAIPGDEEQVSMLEKRTAHIWPKLGAYGRYQGPHVLGNESFFDAEAVFHDPDIVTYVRPGEASGIRLLDRQVTGQNWTRASETKDHPHRIVFYGLKGGVGRSSALSVAAWHLGRKGKKVLLIDFDLESPGLSGILLQKNQMPEYGCIDWFIEDAVGQTEGMIQRVAALSNFSNMPGIRSEIFVVPAFGMKETGYLAKLARVSADLPAREGGLEPFGKRTERFLESLESHYKPDVVLIDSRAGLHDLAAVSIVTLADTALMFALDSDQTWQGYRLLFEHWRQRPEILNRVRNKIVMIHAMFPEVDQERRRQSWLEHSYELFLSTIYEEVQQQEGIYSESFSFDIGQPEAPHYPHHIFWSQRFLEFSEKSITNGIISESQVMSTYGELFDIIGELFPEST
jgi:cellulose biosynthesis protein BcsQ